MNARRAIPPRCWRRAAAVIALLSLGACNALKPLVTPSELPTVYSLAGRPDAVMAAPAPRPAAATSLTLIVSPPHAAAGFDSPRMMYVRRADELEYFAHNEWVDTPARMLAPLIVAAIEARGAFRAVVPTPSPASGEMRLDTEILRLQQEFLGAPSRVRFTLRAYLVESATRRVINSREFEATVDAASDDPRGGVTAAHQAVRRVLTELADFCTRTAMGESQRAAATSRP